MRWSSMMNAIVPAWCLAITLISTGGCSSTLTHVRKARDAFALGDLEAARQGLLEVAESNSRIAAATSLDLAIVELASGDQAAAESRLRQLRDRFDAMPSLAPVSEVAAIATDDNARMFRPAGYEEVMVRTMLAVCSLAGDGADAESYALQANMKQHDLAIQAEDRGVTEVANLYQPIAVAPYIRGIIREATHHDYDDAARAYRLVSAVRPDFAPAQADLQRASVGAHSAAGHGVLYVIACVGRGPVLAETTAPTTSTALTIASVALRRDANEDSEAPTLPNIAAVKIPAVVIPPSPIAAAGRHHRRPTLWHHANADRRWRTGGQSNCRRDAVDHRARRGSTRDQRNRGPWSRPAVGSAGKRRFAVPVRGIIPVER